MYKWNFLFSRRYILIFASLLIKLNHRKMPCNFTSYRSTYLGYKITLIWGEFMPHELYFSCGEITGVWDSHQIKEIFVDQFYMAHSTARDENHWPKLNFWPLSPHLPPVTHSLLQEEKWIIDSLISVKGIEHAWLSCGILRSQPVLRSMCFSLPPVLQWEGHSSWGKIYSCPVLWDELCMPTCPQITAIF